jgi:hypothetical protein
MGATSGRPGTPTKLAFQSVSDLIADYVRLVILADGRWRLAQILSFRVSADWYRTALITADAALLLLRRSAVGEPLAMVRAHREASFYE